MGFESVVAFVILFSVGLSAVVGIAIFYKDYLLRTTNTLDEKQDLLSDKTDSDVDLIEASYSAPELDTMIISSYDDFSDAILDNINATSQLGNITIANDSVVYFESGNWTSNIINMNHPVNFSTLSVSRVVSANTWVGVQIRSSETLSGLIGDFLGPDGTADTYYETSSESINSVHNTHIFMQFKIYMNTTDTSETPVVSEINFTFRFGYGDVTAKIKNSGEIKLSKDVFDIFIDEERIPRNLANLTSSVISSTEITNPGLWDPGETLQISFPYELNGGQSIIRFVNEHSNGDYLAFES